MKNFIALFVTLTMTATAFAVGPAPKELQGGKITVTLKNGKTYTFSSDEYAVVKRGTEEKVFTKAEGEEIAKTHMEEGRKQGEQAAKDAQPKNIVSLGLVRSKNGFDTETTSSTVDVKSRKDFGGSLQYQRRVLDNKYIGGRVDSNGGAEINVGVGF